jgi:hypothetical protein
MRSQGSRRRAALGAALLLVVGLLAGCQSSVGDELEDQLAGIAGVQSVDVDAARVKATLADDLAAADAQTAILAVRDAAVAAHPLGAGVELVVVVPLGERDNGGSAPWAAYAYGQWTATATAETFPQQATFLASLADWATVLSTPARITQLGFTVTATPSDPGAETPTPTDTAAPPETPAPGETPEPAETPSAAQIVTLHLGQPVGAENADADIETLITELGDLWVASGGTPEGITID